MNITDKLEKYFNTGSTDKQNKRRLGGLLIAITAILLVISMLVLAGGGVVAAVGGIIGWFDKPGENEGGGGASSVLVDAAESDVANATATTILLEGAAQNVSVTTFGDISNNAYRFKNGVDKSGGWVYKASLAKGLQADALKAFNAMIAELQNQIPSELVAWANDAYGADESRPDYASGLVVEIYYGRMDEDTASGSAYESEDFEWLFKNAYKYGFVRVSDADGEESVFQYVGIEHAKYIYDKQKSSKETFYGIGSYIADIKQNATPDAPMSLGSVKNLDGKSVSPSVYYMPAAAGEGYVYKLPKEGYDYTMQKTADGSGYIVTYWRAVKK